MRDSRFRTDFHGAGADLCSLDYCCNYSHGDCGRYGIWDDVAVWRDEQLSSEQSSQPFDTPATGAGSAGTADDGWLDRRRVMSDAHRRIKCRKEQ